MNAPANAARAGAVPLVDTADLRRALGSFPTGVTVVTTLDERGELQGLTANAFSAVSLDPPLVLVCVGQRSRSYRSLVRAGRFAIHILSDDQSDDAEHFARPGSARGAAVAWRINGRGLPVLDRYVALIECALHAEHHGGDHAILLGAVEAISHGPHDARPLLYHRGRLLKASALPE